MLQIKNISKVYRTEDIEMCALDGVSTSLRRNEFVSILGPSGSGKTTLLNIIGGLDHYTSGDLIIEGISTKEYSSRDWDTYRNHRVGFVFQSYNLIPHQTVLSNVELALTLSGVPGGEKRRRAKEALKKVGLERHLNKLPSQLSGGQMQRVAIARAIVNNPDIILADEPTGALDSKTSVQIMDLLKEIAKDKLVVMVTHNPELAKHYSTRIIGVKDGKIVADTNPFNDKEETPEPDSEKRSSMSLLTALNLSKNNLLTKRGRTILTAIAGSIGIIGIALILALANGVNKYAENIAGTGSISSPITIEQTYLESTASTLNKNSEEKPEHDGKILATDDIITNSNVNKQSQIRHNDTKALKAYIDEHRSELDQYTDTVQYSYDIVPEIYTTTSAGETILVNPVGKNDDLLTSLFSSTSNSEAEVTINDFLKSPFSEFYSSSPYELLTGTFPKNKNELILVTGQDGQIDLSIAYALDLVDRSKLEDFVNKVNNGGELKGGDVVIDYNSVLNKTYTAHIPNGEETIEETLKVVGVAKAKKEGDSGNFMGYTSGLTEEIANHSSGLYDIASPITISIYAKSDEEKDKVKAFLDNYNNQSEEATKVKYSDTAQELVTGIKKIVNMISYVLIAFVAISLVVSSIMIGIITYISVLERTKEIGILRAIGASKRDVVRVFQAETIIEGFIAGLLGVGTSWLLCQAINAIVGFFNKDIKNIASLSLIQAIILIIISIALTVIAGALPARRASKKDPVEALRSE